MKKYIDRIPPNIRRFALTVLIIFVLWKLSYHLYLKPHRIIDVPLTNITTQTTVFFLQHFTHFTNVLWSPKMPNNNIDIYGTVVSVNGQKAIGIFDPCNALELYILYIGFLICLPTSFKRFTIFALGGIAAIFILNILRCSGLVWFRFYSRQWFDFAHHYLFSLTVYMAIFGLWIWYSKAIKQLS